jgi:hypothetical protein
MPVAPDEIELTFGIQLSAEFGAIVTNATSTANFAITMRWARAAAPNPTLLPAPSDGG